MKITVIKEFSFDAAHILEGDQGGCGRMHGHTWKGEIHCQGSENELEHGILVDFRKIKEQVKKLDHCFLNDVLAAMGCEEPVYRRPTAEHLAMLLLKAIPRCVKVILYESPENRVEVTHV